METNVFVTLVVIAPSMNLGKLRIGSHNITAMVRLITGIPVNENLVVSPFITSPLYKYSHVFSNKTNALR